MSQRESRRFRVRAQGPVACFTRPEMKAERVSYEVMTPSAARGLLEATQKEAEAQGGDNRTMGRKMTVPYGLYRAHGFISPALARQTGFGEKDLELLWQALGTMFEHDRSAARGLMATQRLIVFQHDSELGNAPAHRLFERVKLTRKDTSRPSRDFSDYELVLETPPSGVQRLEPGL